MFRVAAFEPSVAVLLPETYALLTSANLTLDSRVSRVILHGSRGPAGGFRPDSDVDLSLIVEPWPSSTQSEREVQLREISEVTLSNWRGAIEADLAVVFDLRGCGLKCFDREIWDDQFCAEYGVDCFGLYKTQKGFSGMVTKAGVRVRWMYPCLKIWQRP